MSFTWSSSVYPTKVRIVSFSYSPPPRRRSLLRMRQMRMRKIFVANDQLLFAHAENIHILYWLTARHSKRWMFSVCVVAELSVAPTNSSPLVPTTVNTQHSPRRTKHAPTARRDPSPGLPSIHLPRPLQFAFFTIYNSVSCHHPTL